MYNRAKGRAQLFNPLENKPRFILANNVKRGNRSYDFGQVIGVTQQVSKYHLSPCS